MSSLSFIDLTGDSDDESDRPGLHTRSTNINGRSNDGTDAQSAISGSTFSMRNYQPSPRPSPPSRSRSRYVTSSHGMPNYRTHQNLAFHDLYGDRQFATPPPPLLPPPPRPDWGPRPPSVTTARHGRTCQQCHSYPDVSCDGDQPCAPCQAVGDECIYEGQDPSVVRVQLAHTYNRAHQSRSLTGQLADSSTTNGDQHLNSTQSSNHNHVRALNSFQGTIDQEELDSDFEDVNNQEDSLRFDLDSLEGVKGLLQMHEARMRAHREYLMQPLLARAKLVSINSLRPATSVDRMNPFDQLPVKSRSKYPTNTRSTLTLQMRSHLPGVAKKWTPVTTPLTVVGRDRTILPKYKSIGRLGNVVLARNSYVKKYLPYFADEVPEAERKREEDISKWYQTDHDSIDRQRNCLELVQLWKPTVEQFISNLEIQFKDILWYILSASVNVHCATCRKSIKKEKFAAALEILNKPDDTSLNRAQLACDALEKVAKIHMWHIVAEIDYVRGMIDVSEKIRQPTSSLCAICFVHDCMSHGCYDEPSDEEAGTFDFMGGSSGKRRPMMINDDEKDVNRRTSIVVPYRHRENVHQCGIFCVDATTPLQAVLGKRIDGSTGGVYNRTTKVTRPAFDNFEECGSLCFWRTEKRIRFPTVAHTKSFEPNFSEDGKVLFTRLLKLYSANQRAPCMVSHNIDDLTCMDAFYYILAVGQHPAHFDQVNGISQEKDAQKSSRSGQNIDTSLSSELDQRPPFIPCSHEGPCNENPECRCSQDLVHCEFFCGCDSSCKRRFHGCSCAGRNKVCFNDDRCECWAQNRECDPWLCKSCGAVEVLDPANKYKEEIRRGRCKNTHLQLDLPARTIKAPSEVQGWGLYAGQDLDAHAFIGEYKGEIVGNQESDRRGSIYHHLGQEYLFVTNTEQQIDGSNFGNKTRFINNSQRNDYINVLPKKLLCYGVQRIMLYSKRPIKAGDELLYNYNYPDSVTKTFWERGEGPAQTAGAVVAKPAPPTSARSAKIADHHGSHRSGSRSSSKRKRVSEHDPYSQETAFARRSGNRNVVSDSDASDQDGVQEESDDEDVGSEDSSSADIRTPSTVIRKRRIHPEDGRLGIDARGKAWLTRNIRATSGHQGGLD